MDSLSSKVKVFYYNQTSKIGSVFADITSILVGEGVTNPTATVLDVSNMCLFLSVGNHVYRYNGSVYKNISLPSGWANANFDDTYQIAIFNNSIYQYISGAYTSVYTTNSTSSFYSTKFILYQPTKILVYSYVKNGSLYPFRVHCLMFNGTKWNNIKTFL